MTDERLGERLFEAVARLPEGSGIVFRHSSLPPAERKALFDEVRARSAAHVLLLAGPEDLARDWGADGSHGRGPGPWLRSAPVHDEAELRAASSAGLLFVSPVFKTRSHPGAKLLGVDGFEALARRAQAPVIALGGMNAARFATLPSAHGWAAIDAWLP
jgi:thiamine-phosphate pyrophosphorylase